jgi:hypothetical protein
MARDDDRRAADPAATAACSIGEIDSRIDSKFASNRQVFDDLGHRLPATRSPIVGQPRRATPSWYRLACDRWCEAAL